MPTSAERLEYLKTRIVTLGGFVVDGARVRYFPIPFRVKDEPWPFWRTERTVEIALIARFLKGVSGRGLEVGNVMHLYLDRPRVVVDKYEKGPAVLNVDILDFAPAAKFEWIVCCSTLEHVGWDEEPREPEKCLRALARLRELLAPGGRMLLTIPLGYNSFVDQAIRDGRIKGDHQSTFSRSSFNRWKQTDLGTDFSYDFDAGHALQLWAGEFTEPARS
jgi:SAM-dependent methyltransferase